MHRQKGKYNLVGELTRLSLTSELGYQAASQIFTTIASSFVLGISQKPTFKRWPVGWAKRKAAMKK